MEITKPNKGKKAKKDHPESLEGHDPARMGYHRKDFGPDDKENHYIHDAYVKGSAPDESESTSIHDIAHHAQVSSFFSGGHKGGKKMRQGNENG